MRIDTMSVHADTPKGRPSSNERLEQAFLEEMLKYCGPSARQGAFGGGTGEDQFATFLTERYASILAEKLDFRLRIDSERPA